MKKILLLLVLLGVAAGLLFLTKRPLPLFFTSGFPVPGSAELRNPQDLLDLFSQSGKQSDRIVIPPGIYRFCDTSMPGITVKNLRDTAIIADGVTILFKSGQTFRLRDCEAVTLSGLTVDYDPVPFTQGEITELDGPGKSLTVVLEEGYPTVESLPQTGNFLFFVFDPLTSEPRPVLNDGVRQVTQVADKTYKLSHISNGFLFDSLGEPGGVQKGDRIALFSRSGYAIEIHGCHRVGMDRVTVYSSPGYAFWEAEGGGDNHYYQCRILRKPGTTRLITTVADGFHSYRVRKGPVIEDCQFEDTVDDTIAIHGFFSMVLEAPSAHTVYVVSPFGQDFSAGAKLSFYEMPHGRPLGGAVVKTVESIPASALSVPVADVRQSFIKERLNLRDLPVTQALKVELDRDIDLPKGRLVLTSSDEQCGSGAIVRNNTLRRGHVRGVIVKADNVLVEGNRFEGIGANAILVFPELYFLEGPVSRGVTIRGNIITHCGWRVLNPRFANPGIGGAIQTCAGMARRQFPPQFDPYPVIRDVSISNNVIKDSGSYGIVLGNVSSGQVSGNTIEYPFNKPGSRESKGLDRVFDSQEHALEKTVAVRANPSGILVYGSKNVSFTENTVMPPAGKGGVSSFLIGPWCENIETGGIQ